MTIDVIVVMLHVKPGMLLLHLRMCNVCLAVMVCAIAP
jgi:hypothetical protein